MSDELISQQGLNAEQTPHLRRVLGLWDVIFYGIVLISQLQQ